MFYKLRYRLATCLANRSAEYIKKGGFDNIKKGLDYLKLSVSIVPPSQELSEFGNKLKELATHIGDES